MRDDINKRLCELLGICWHEQIDDQTLQCKHCGAPMLFPWQQNPDFTSEKGRIDLLRRMENHPNGKLFFAQLTYAGDNVEAIDDDGLIQRSYILDDNGALARVALEFLEANHA